MRNKYLRICVLCVIIAAVLLAGCVNQQDADATAEPTDADTTVTEQTDLTETIPATVDEHLEYVLVSTRYGSLRYQEQWMELMQTSVTEEGEQVIVEFQTTINDVKYPLFRVVIGGEEDGAVGQLTDAQGTARNVYIIPNEFKVISELTEGEQNRLYAMFEEINYIMDNLE